METATAVLCACLPTYRPLVASLKLEIFSRFSSLYRSKQHDSTRHGWPNESMKRATRIGRPIAQAFRQNRSRNYHDTDSSVDLSRLDFAELEFSQSGAGRVQEPQKPPVSVLNYRRQEAQVSMKEIVSREVTLC